MGNNAKSKYSLIDSKKHIVLTSVHPSPIEDFTDVIYLKKPINN